MRDVKEISYDFILCKERTGSSFLTVQLNKYANVLAVAEETFSLYLAPKYQLEKTWEISSKRRLYNDFYTMRKKNLNLFYSERSVGLDNVLNEKRKDLTYQDMVKLILLQFFPEKNKEDISHIVDKQIDYMFHIEDVMNVFPKAKFVVLTRDPRSNVEACIRRNLGRKDVYYQAELWNTYYRKVLPFLQDERFIFVKYEDLILNTKKVVLSVLDHFGVKTDAKIDDDVFEKTIGKRQQNVEDEFNKSFSDFHAGLSQEANIDKLTEYKNRLATQEIRIIESITSEFASQLGYEFEKEKLSKEETLKWQKASKAVFRDKDRLLNFYFNLPVWLKLFIKKIRKSRVDV
ncbi:sulfotransferase family protein [Parvicella tangerina]|uniref:Sulfotransferase n=1 Tax=Parvicella tangerina TaxID=2829795 RepID=A0A916JKX8_9FLAO|nr:sulfotransferase [Parvicella tangerina]CAG5079116.1 hypothetical protein CRYO30217_00861 [Parvicella tangerina]